MKKLFVFIFCICAITKVKSFVIDINLLLPATDSSIETKEGKEYMSKEFYTNVTNYTITVNDDITYKNDISIHYEYYSDVEAYKDLVAEGTTTLCSADYSDFDGTVAALVSKALGIQNNPPCPIKAGTYNQESMFNLDDGEFGGLFDDSYRDSIILSITDGFSIQMEIIRDERFWANLSGKSM